MKKLTLSTLCVIIPIFSIFSQSNYKEGYIITMGNDTVHGLIDFRTDQTNSLMCRFKPNAEAEEENFLPGEIIGYRFIHEGKYYISRTVDIDSLKKTVFLEFLVQGLLNLYYLPKDNGYYFFEEKDGSLKVLTKQPDKIIENNKLKIDNQYKGILSYISRDCLPLAFKTSKVDFNKESFIEFTKDYHEQMCDFGEQCIIFENDYKKKFTKCDFTAYSGFEFNNIELYAFSFPKMLSLSPVIGVGLNISSPRVMKSLSLMLDATLSKIAGAFDYSNSYMSYSQYNFSGIKSNWGGGLEYIYQKGIIRPTINVGFSYCYLFNLKSTLKTDNQIFENEILIQNMSIGIKTGLGVDYKIRNDQFIIVKLIYSKHFNDFEYNDTYQLRIGYKF